MSVIDVYFNNDLERLAALCNAALQDDGDASLEPEYVLVHSQGMAHWLQCYIARQQGIAARINFLFPGHFLDELRTRCLGEQNIDCWKPDQSLWRILHALHESRAPALRNYLGNHQQSARAYQLAASLSETFDAYRLYRPQQLQDWLVTDSDDNWSWQYQLLQQLAAEQTPLQALDDLRQALRDVKSEQLPRRLFIFGMSSLAPGYLETLAVLATRIPVTLYSLAPSPNYIGDLLAEHKLLRLQDAEQTEALDHYDVGNAFIAQCGTSSCEFQRLLDSVGAEFRDSDWLETAEDSLLHRVQRDVYLVQEAGRNEWPDHQRAEDDHSIQLHNCHSPQRELEVLRDYLLRCFQADETLRTDDVIIMAPDPDVYSATIDAVFNYMHDGNEIPISLADQHQRGTRELVDALLMCLDVLNSRLEKHAVLDLLQLPPVRERWGWNSDSINEVEALIDAAGVHWGRDAAHRRALGLGAYAEYSWHTALQRLLLSWFYGDDDGQMAPLQGLLPLTGAEQYSNNIFSSLLHCCQELCTLHAQLPQCRSISDWEALLERVLTFITVDEATHAAGLQYLRAQIRDCTQAMRRASEDLSLNSACMLQHLRNILQEANGRQGFYDGRITFSGLKPMRSIPFRLICLIGMNDKAFPRQQTRMDIDLSSNAQRCIGDRDLNKEDRQLFLETLLSCRETLYISYCGQNVKDQKQAPAAHLIEEFIDYLARTCGDDSHTLRKQLVTQHHLHPTHPDYTAADSRMPSQSPLFYLQADQRTTGQVFLQGIPPANVPRHISFSELLGFWQDPLAWLLQLHFQIRHKRIEDRDSSSDEFYWDGLDDWQLREGLFADEASMSSERLQAGGVLPVKDHGQILLDQRRVLLQEMIELRQTLQESPPRTITLGEWRISLDGHSCNAAQEMHLLIPHAYNAKRRLAAWLRHLCLNVAEPQLSHVSSLHNDQTLHETLESVGQAPLLLETLLDGFAEGHQQLIPFFLETAFTYASTIHKGKNPEQTATAVERKWQSGEGRSMQVALVSSNPQTLVQDPAFAQWASDVWGPYFEHGGSA